MRNNDLLKYAGLATQFIVTLGVAIFIGYKSDKFLAFRFPLFTISLPMLALIISFWKIYKDSNEK